MRAATLGGLLTAGTLGGTLLLGRLTLRSWPGTAAVDADAALLALSLTAATTLLGWVTVVLAAASADLARPARRPRSYPPPVRARAVRWTSTLLLALTVAPAAAAAGPPEPTWTTVVEQPTEESGGRSSDEPSGALDVPDTPAPVDQEVTPVLPDGSPVTLPGWTPPPPRVVHPSSDSVGLVSAVPRESAAAGVVVRRGDTLWAIAARHLGPGSTVQDVAEEWPRWYATNKELIGPDPDLILPGQELAPPPAEVGR